MLDYDMPLWRPPSEGHNLIIQATIGCSYNHCTFCSNYMTKTFREKPIAELEREIASAARDWPDADRIFLADGDAFVISTENLLAILDRLRAAFPRFRRATAYSTPMNILKKPLDELVELRERGMSMLYLGIESGNTDMLRRIKKGATQKTMARALDKAREAGIKISATVILGLGGKRCWKEHIDETAALVNMAPPAFLSTLQLEFRMPGVEERYRDAFGEPFERQSDDGVLDEIERLVEKLDPVHPVVFRSNHASNCLPLAGDLPRDRDKILDTIAMAKHGAKRLRPKWMRGTYHIPGT